MFECMPAWLGIARTRGLQPVFARQARAIVDDRRRCNRRRYGVRCRPRHTPFSDTVRRKGAELGRVSASFEAGSLLAIPATAQMMITNPRGEIKSACRGLERGGGARFAHVRDLHL